MEKLESELAVGSWEAYLEYRQHFKTPGLKGMT